MIGHRHALLLLPLIALGAPAFAGDNGPFANTFLANEGQWPQDILFAGRSAAANVSLLQPDLIATRKKIIGDTRRDTLAWLTANNYKVIGE